MKLPTHRGVYQAMLDKSPLLGVEGGYSFWLTDGDNVRMILYYGDYYGGVIGATTLSTGVWHHVAGVYDGSQIRIYVDGQLDGVGTLDHPMTHCSVPMRIGRNNYLYDNSHYFMGLVDEIRVSAGALYTGAFTPAPHLTAATDTRGLWKFDGQTPNDFSANGNNGTLFGGATFSTASLDVTTGYTSKSMRSLQFFNHSSKPCL